MKSYGKILLGLLLFVCAGSLSGQIPVNDGVENELNSTDSTLGQAQTTMGKPVSNEAPRLEGLDKPVKKSSAEQAKDDEYVKRRLRQLEKALKEKTRAEIIREKKLEPVKKGFDDDLYSEKKELQNREKLVGRNDEELEEEVSRRLGTETLLKNFGADFFERGEMVQTNLMAGSAPSNYQLGPGDELKIIVWSELGDETVYDVQVNPEGQIYVPMLGVMGVSGLTVGEFEQMVLGSLAGKFKHFKGQVTLTQVRTIQIYVVGEVEKPGALTVSGLTTAFTALYQAGGPTERGSMRKIKVMGANGKSVELDLYRYFLSGDRSQDVSLKNGDTIFVSAIENRVKVAGLVTRPAIYEVLTGDSLAKVIAMAGNVLPDAYSGRVKITRWTGNQRRQTYDVSLANLEELQNFIIEDGDEIKIEGAIETVGNLVSIEGAVKKPGNYAVYEGLTVAELISRSGGLVEEEANKKFGQIIRKGSAGAEEILTFNLRFAMLGDKDENLVLKPFDQVKIFAQDEIQADIRSVNIDGAVRQPGEYVYRDGMKLGDLILKARGLAIDAASEAEVARVDGNGSKIIKVNVKSAFENTKSEDNIMLQPLDRISVLSRGDNLMEPEVVVLKGQVKRPGPYALEYRGEPLSSVIKRAGGLTNMAFAEGAVFMRRMDHIASEKQLETAKEVQNEMFRQATLDLRADLLKAGAKLDNLGQVRQEIEGGKSIAEQVLGNGLLDRSGETVAKRSSDDERSGYGGIAMTSRALSDKMVRIPVPLKDIVAGKAEKFEDIALLNGDQITVPVVPTTVSVLGAVVNPTTILFARNRSAGYYINRSGGFSPSSNHSKTVVVRANGEVLPMRHVRHIERGDMILVPPKARLIRGDRMKEWSNIMSILGNLAVTYKVANDL
ncbi:MAG: SLBB domain-containing protein [Candidatus Riflebacteria bacterium]